MGMVYFTVLNCLQGWLQCEDSVCGARTNKVPLIMQRGRPVCAACDRGVLQPEVTPSSSMMWLKPMANEDLVKFICLLLLEAHSYIGRNLLSFSLQVVLVWIIDKKCIHYILIPVAELCFVHQYYSYP